MGPHESIDPVKMGIHIARSQSQGPTSPFQGPWPVLLVDRDVTHQDYCAFIVWALAQNGFKNL